MFLFFNGLICWFVGWVCYIALHLNSMLCVCYLRYTDASIQWNGTWKAAIYFIVFHFVMAFFYADLFFGLLLDISEEFMSDEQDDNDDDDDNQDEHANYNAHEGNITSQMTQSNVNNGWSRSYIQQADANVSGHRQLTADAASKFSW